MPSESGSRACKLLLSILFAAAPGHAEVLLAEGTNLAADVAAGHGRIAIDLLGSIWVLPGDGGDARLLSDNPLPARRPRWSPDGSRILYQTETAASAQIWAIGADGSNTTKLSGGDYFDRDADWHPDGERIVFSSARRLSGFDLWETDLPTGLSWRLTSEQGDETEPAWSADGRSLAYIHYDEGRWSLMLRRHGRPAAALLESGEPLYAPSWRPDGSLITFLRQSEHGLSIDMAILSDPPLIRSLLTGEDFFLSPVSWPDRSRFVYTADGMIKTRGFDDWESTPVGFSAVVGQAGSRAGRSAKKQRLPQPHGSEARLVIRAARLFDGTGDGYRHDVDVFIDGPRIAAVKPRREWPEATILNLGNATVLPGFIDSYSSVASRNQKQHGAELLSYGLTTLITDDPPKDYDPLLWESEEFPGPRLLWAGEVAQSHPAAETRVQFVTIPSSGLSDADGRSAVADWQAQGIPVLAESWRVGLAVGADLLLGLDSLPASPQGNRYQDIRLAVRSAPIALLSGLADAGTPGLAALFQSRQAQLLQTNATPLRRFASVPNLANSTAAIMLGSKPSGLPPGLALHAELRALAAAGLSGDQVLRAAGSTPARVLGLDEELGHIAEGALADLVIVIGDPLETVADTMNIVAVVRGGRFFSLVSLLERAAGSPGVE